MRITQYSPHLGSSFLLKLWKPPLSFTPCLHPSVPSSTTCIWLIILKQRHQFSLFTYFLRLLFLSFLIHLFMCDVNRESSLCSSRTKNAVLKRGEQSERGKHAYMTKESELNFKWALCLARSDAMERIKCTSETSQYS